MCNRWMSGRQMCAKVMNADGQSACVAVPRKPGDKEAVFEGEGEATVWGSGKRGGRAYLRT